MCHREAAGSSRVQYQLTWYLRERHCGRQKIRLIQTLNVAVRQIRLEKRASWGYMVYDRIVCPVSQYRKRATWERDSAGGHTSVDCQLLNSEEDKPRIPIVS